MAVVHTIAPKLEITVTLPRLLGPRLWIIARLINLAGWIAGKQITVTMGVDEPEPRDKAMELPLETIIRDGQERNGGPRPSVPPARNFGVDPIVLALVAIAFGLVGVSFAILAGVGG